MWNQLENKAYAVKHCDDETLQEGDSVTAGTMYVNIMSTVGCGLTSNLIIFRAYNNVRGGRRGEEGGESTANNNIMQTWIILQC